MGSDVITQIDPPKSREQLALLLMRRNALSKMGVEPSTGHEEMVYLTSMLHELAEQQRQFEARKAELEQARKASASAHAEPLDLKPQLAAFKLLFKGLDLPAHIREDVELSANFKSDPHNESRENQPKSSSERLGELLGQVVDVPDTILRNRMSRRVIELERLSSNLGTVEFKNTDFTPPDELGVASDALKAKAIIELKGLRLLAKQKSLRQHLIYNAAATSEDSVIAQSHLLRSVNRRIKNSTAQELNLTEELERRQRHEREQQARHSQIELTRSAINRSHDFAQQVEQYRQRKNLLQKHIYQFHTHVEREESRRAERTAKQRLLALRSNDEEAYIKLLDQTKDTRITHLLKQTNQFLASLSEAVRVQQAEAGSSLPTPSDEELEKIDYYEVAHRIKEPITEQASLLVGGQLKEYQIRGLEWMISLVNNNLNGILADEMGLGKTIQSISLITYLIDKKRWTGPFLVIVPLSTITNWTVEFDKWAPSVKTVVYKGPPNARKAQQAIIRSGDFQVLLTTYEYVIKDRPLLSKIRWQHMIIDEGHRMKNTQSKLSYTLVNHYFSRHRLILTGTPLQNNLPELWALLNFVLPKIFNSQKTFDEWFNTPFANTGSQDKMELTEEETLLIIRRLHKVLRPFLLRRLKKDVEKDLPDKVEKVIKCKMSALQQALYEQMLKYNVIYTGEQAVQNGNGKSLNSGIRSLNNKIMQLRKICNHPFVFEEVERVVNPMRTTNELLWRTAGKFELLDRILPKFRDTNHRVLIFFQMTQIMDIMEDYLSSSGIKYLRLDGSTKAEERSDKLRLFNAEDSPYFCFLLSTRAGGLGLNLQTADTVIIYDTDWNPFQDLQAQDRAHRIGQTKEVRILRLISDHTIEEAILDRAVSKLEIDGKVIQAGKFDNKSTNEEQEAFLRNLMEAEEVRRENKDQEEEEMDDEELNQILARSEDEIVKFRELDEARNEEERRSGKSRLFSQQELPQIYQEDIGKKLAGPTYEELGSRRERRRVIYDDGLTEAEWLRQQEVEAEREEEDDDEDEEEEAKFEDEDEDDETEVRREKNGAISDGDDSDAMRDDTPDVKPARGRTPKSKRSSSSLNGKRSKRIKTESPAPTEVVNQANALLELISVQTATDPERSRSAVFLELPSRRDYPDYFKIIKKPISLAEIRAKLDAGKYQTIKAVKSDLMLMLNNARTYNVEGSLIYDDANFLEGIVNQA